MFLIGLIHVIKRFKIMLSCDILLKCYCSYQDSYYFDAYSVSAIQKAKVQS